MYSFGSFPLDLFGCQVAATSTTVESAATLTITASYMLSSSSSTVTLYLANDDITSFFPGAVSSDIVTFLLYPFRALVL